MDIHTCGQLALTDILIVFFLPVPRLNLISQSLVARWSHVTELWLVECGWRCCTPFLVLASNYLPCKILLSFPSLKVLKARNYRWQHHKMEEPMCPNDYAGPKPLLLITLCWRLVVKNPLASVGRHKRCEFYPCVEQTPWRRKWQPTPVFLLGESHGQRSLAGCSPQGHKESNTTERTWHTCMHVMLAGNFVA